MTIFEKAMVLNLMSKLGRTLSEAEYIVRNVPLQELDKEYGVVEDVAVAFYGCVSAYKPVGLSLQEIKEQIMNWNTVELSVRLTDLGILSNDDDEIASICFHSMKLQHLYKLRKWNETLDLESPACRDSLDYIMPTEYLTWENAEQFFENTRYFMSNKVINVFGEEFEADVKKLMAGNWCMDAALNNVFTAEDFVQRVSSFWYELTGKLKDFSTHSAHLIRYYEKASDERGNTILDCPYIGISKYVNWEDLGFSKLPGDVAVRNKEEQDERGLQPRVAEASGFGIKKTEKIEKTEKTKKTDDVAIVLDDTDYLIAEWKGQKFKVNPRTWNEQKNEILYKKFGCKLRLVAECYEP